MTASSSSPVWLGIDLGGTKILAEVFDSRWKSLGVKKKKTKAELGQKIGVQRVLEAGRLALEEAGIDPARLGGVGIGCPGVLNLETGVLVKASNLGWENVPIKHLLEEEFGCPAAVANDVDAGTYGEYTHGAGKGARTVLGVFPGTGIGGGLVYEGSIFRGKRWSCLELGHIQIVPDGPRCGCGRQGCVEAVSGRLAISTAASAAVLRGQAPWLQENVGSDPADIRSGALASAIENGDEVIRDIVQQAFRPLGQFLGGMVNLLAPDVLVIGGGLAEAMPRLCLETIEESMQPKIMDALEDVCTLRLAKLGDHATTLGSAAWVRHEVEE